jgi:oligopeptide/dipeptide ABC transporter ATP-binding protein
METSASVALLEARGLHVRFYARKGLFRRQPIFALNGVDLSLEPGEAVAVVGESGSGKTTLGRALLRLVDPAEGAVVFEGEDVTRLAPAKLQPFRRKVQAIFQDPYSSINPYMTVGQIVREPLDVHGAGEGRERAERAGKALADAGLRPPEVFIGKYPHTLSGGQRQRVGIARALALEPKVIIADEPVSMIDASSRAEVLYLMRDLQARYGIAFLYITHDIASARHFSDRVAVMYLGRIVEEGPPGLVIERPLHPYTQALVEAVPEPDPANRLRQRAVIPGEPPSPAAIPTGCPFHPRCPKVMPGLCERVRPLLREVREGQRVACLLYEEEGRRYHAERPAAQAAARASASAATGAGGP